MLEDDARAPFAFRLAYRAIHVAFCAVGGILEAEVCGMGGEKCVAEVCVLFIEVRGVYGLLSHGVQGFCFDVIFACEIVETSHGREVLWNGALHFSVSRCGFELKMKMSWTRSLRHVN